MTSTWVQKMAADLYQLTLFIATSLLLKTTQAKMEVGKTAFGEKRLGANIGDHANWRNRRFLCKKTS
jgi:hypothetical protein